METIEVSPDMALRLAGKERITADYIKSMLQEYARIDDDNTLGNLCEAGLFSFVDDGVFGEFFIEAEFFRLVSSDVKKGLHEQFGFMFHVRKGETSKPYVLCYIPYGKLYCVPEEYVGYTNFGHWLRRARCMYTLDYSYTDRPYSDDLYIKRAYNIYKTSIVAVNDVLILQNNEFEDGSIRKFIEPMYFCQEEYPRVNDAINRFFPEVYRERHKYDYLGTDDSML